MSAKLDWANYIIACLSAQRRFMVVRKVREAYTGSRKCRESLFRVRANFKKTDCGLREMIDDEGPHLRLLGSPGTTTALKAASSLAVTPVVLRVKSKVNSQVSSRDYIKRSYKEFNVFSPSQHVRPRTRFTRLGSTRPGSTRRWARWSTRVVR
ncbi:hypothetical protein FOCC_FOCC008632, partial [Frankliniella occidentalis]